MKKLKSGGDNECTNSEDKKENGVSNSCIWVLPAAILLEIFLRLPIAVIMKCKLVCTAWHKLLSESTFIGNYSRNPPFTQFLVPVIPRVSIPRFVPLYLLEISNNGNCIQTPIKPKLPYSDWLNRESCLDFIGSCNGLLCICMRKPGVDIVYVCNPIKRDYIALPQYECTDKRVACYKFGFIPSTSNFKVLRISGKARPKKECEIFTVGVDDRWRSLAVPFKDFFFWPGAVTLNGAFHCILQVENEGPFLLHTFDLAEEKAGQISHPPGVVLDPNMEFTFFNNQLGLVDYSVKSRFTIWRMKEYGNAESWTKDVIRRRWFPSGMRSRSLVPVGGLQSGDILFAHDTNLISFNVKQKKCSKIEVFAVGNGLDFMEPYDPSFSSLNEVKMNGQWRSMMDI